MQHEVPYSSEFFDDYAAWQSGAMPVEEFQRRCREVWEPLGMKGSIFGAEWDAQQAIASAKIEGFVPDSEFLADFAATTAGTMSTEEFIERAAARAHAIEDANNAARARRKEDAANLKKASDAKEDARPR